MGLGEGEFVELKRRFRTFLMAEGRDRRLCTRDAIEKGEV